MGSPPIFFATIKPALPIIDALIEAHRRGVAVRVIIDGIGGGYFHNAAHVRLQGAGVPCRLFMHSTLPWRMPFLNLRSHKKVLVADGRLAFTGGLNIGARESAGVAAASSGTRHAFPSHRSGDRADHGSFAEDWCSCRARPCRAMPGFRRSP